MNLYQLSNHIITLMLYYTDYKSITFLKKLIVLQIK